MRISLVGTVHEESGLVTVGALEEILERARPEVIFAEIPSTHGDRYKDGSHATLESVAVARYLATRHVDVVPVDLGKPEQTFFEDTKDMIRSIERTSADFRRLMDAHSAATRSGGFPYLNSERCMQAWTDIYREELATIEWIDNPRLRGIYDRWSHTIELRDIEMLKNISTYSGRASVQRAAFLVGAAHRGSLIEKAAAVARTSSTRIDWDLDSFLGIVA